MSYTNNIYIPYIDGFHNENNFNLYKNYYEKIGFNVKKIKNYKSNEIFYPKLINDTIKNNLEDTYIVIDYIIVSKFALDLSIEIAHNYKSLVKPINKIYIIDDVVQGESIIDSVLNHEAIDYMYYDIDKRYETWPMGGAWVFPSNILNKNIEVNENLNYPLAFDFEFCYKNSIFNNIIFLQTDGYKINPASPNFHHNVSFVYEEYLHAVKNLFGTPENVFKYKNMILDKVDKNKIEDLVFNVERYMSLPRYI